MNKITRLMESLGSPQDKIPAIHVAGTNGKGSTSVACASILSASGAKVGLISSPHLIKMNERIIIDGSPITDAELDSYAAVVSDAAFKASLELSFFEAITACGFLAFSEHKVDWFVAEVGLGGRLDATNVIAKPEVAIVTTIDFDHQDLLGNSLSQIAGEKAGIFKRGSTAIIGELKAEPREALILAASELDMKWHLAEKDFAWNTRNVNSDEFEYRSQEFGTFVCQPGLHGKHQAQNMSVAITAARALGVSVENCCEGVGAAFWPARLEEFSHAGSTYILDCAHNLAGIEVLTSNIKDRNLGQITLVFGALESKNWREMLTTILPYVSEVILIRPKSPNALDPMQIAMQLSGNEVRVRNFEEDYDAALQYLESSKKNEAVVFSGSIYMVGEFRKLLRNQEVTYWPSRSTRSTSSRL